MNRIAGMESLRPKYDRVLLLSNLVLILVAVSFVLISISHFNRQVTDIVMSESRFITTEWGLLRQLKAQTDRDLLEKETEIAALTVRYQALLGRDASSRQLQQLEDRLKKAQDEREEILLHREEKPVAPPPELTARLSGLMPANNSSAITRLLQRRIIALESQLEEREQHILELEKDIFTPEASLPLVQNSIETASVKTQLVRLAAAIRAMADEAETREKAAAEAQPSISRTDLATRTRLRAIADSASVRAEYPDLLASFDRYLENLALLERMKGRREAWNEAAGQLKKLEKETEGL